MNRIDILKQVKNSAINVMQDRRVLASLLIAESILISENYKEIENNNPLRFKTNDNILIEFNSIEDCFNCFIYYLTSGRNKDRIIGNYDYVSLIRALNLDNSINNSLIEIIQAYKLDEIDKQVLNDLYSGKRTVIEIDKEPFIDCYKVREAFGSNKTEVMVTFDKEEAIRECKKYYGYSVFNSKGDVVFNNALTPELKAKMELDSRIMRTPTTKIGSKIFLNRVNLYEFPDSKTPMRCVTGQYYICDDKRYNNRYMITDKPENINNSSYVLGYINAKDKK